MCLTAGARKAEEKLVTKKGAELFGEEIG